MTARTYFGRLARGSQRNFADALRAENTGAILLLLGAVVALVGPDSCHFSPTGRVAAL